MTPVNPIPEGEDVRRRILDAAEARFRVFGYRKTTMAEIAEDVDMSAANLYRYFEDKQDIAAACAGRCMGGRAELLREVVKRPGLAAGGRLESFVLAMLRYTHDLAHNQKKINELVEIVASERPETVREKNRAEQALIAEILAQGNANGEFEVAGRDRDRESRCTRRWCCSSYRSSCLSMSLRSLRRPPGASSRSWYGASPGGKNFSCIMNSV